jgi:serine/threonine protein phosphatase PrpC
MIRRPIKILAAVLAAALAVQDAAWAAPDAFDGAWADWAARGGKAGLPKVAFTVPESAGFVDGGYRAPAPAAGEPERLVILLQDAHVNPSAQLNAARILHAVMAAEKIRTVHTEGAGGDVTLSRMLRADFDPEAVRAAAEPLVRKGRLTGFEFADLSDPGTLTLHGVEDEALYDEALALYRAAAADRAAAVRFLDRASRAAETLAEELLGAELQALRRTRAAHQEGGLSTVDYFARLTAAGASRGVRAREYQHLGLFRRLVREEQRLDFEAIAVEQAEALAALTDEDRASLGELAADAGLLGRSAYWESARELGAEVRRGSQLARYLSYLNRARQMDAPAVSDELDRFEEEVFMKLAPTGDARGLMEVIRGLETLRELITLRAAPAAFGRYMSARAAHDPARLTAFLNTKIHALGRYYDQAVFLDDAYDAAEKASREFYALSVRRDAAMVRNLTERMDAAGETRAVLVAGGYHAPGVERELRARGISYISIVPAATQPTDTGLYEKILLAQRPSGRSAPSTASRFTPAASGLIPRPLAAALRVSEPAALETARSLGLELDGARMSSPIPVSTSVPARVVWVRKDTVREADPAAAGLAADPEALAARTAESAFGTTIDRWGDPDLLPVMREVIGDEALDMLKGSDGIVRAVVSGGLETGEYGIEMEAGKDKLIFVFTADRPAGVVRIAHGGLRLRERHLDARELARKDGIETAMLRRFVEANRAGRLLGWVPSRIDVDEVFPHKRELFKKAGFNVIRRPYAATPFNPNHMSAVNWSASIDLAGSSAARMSAGSDIPEEVRQGMFSPEAFRRVAVFHRVFGEEALSGLRGRVALQALTDPQNRWDLVRSAAETVSDHWDGFATDAFVQDWQKHFADPLLAVAGFEGDPKWDLPAGPDENDENVPFLDRGRARRYKRMAMLWTVYLLQLTALRKVPGGVSVGVPAARQALSPLEEKLGIRGEAGNWSPARDAFLQRSLAEKGGMKKVFASDQPLTLLEAYRLLYLGTRDIDLSQLGHSDGWIRKMIDLVLCPESRLADPEDRVAAVVRAPVPSAARLSTGVPVPANSTADRLAEALEEAARSGNRSIPVMLEIPADPRRHRPVQTDDYVLKHAGPDRTGDRIGFELRRQPEENATFVSGRYDPANRVLIAVKAYTHPELRPEGGRFRAAMRWLSRDAEAVVMAIGDESGIAAEVLRLFDRPEGPTAEVYADQDRIRDVVFQSRAMDGFRYVLVRGEGGEYDVLVGLRSDGSWSALEKWAGDSGGFFERLVRERLLASRERPDLFGDEAGIILPAGSGSRMAHHADPVKARAERLKRSILNDGPIRKDLKRMGADIDRLTALPFYGPGRASFGFGRRTIEEGLEQRPSKSHITAQGDLLSEDMARLIRQREASGDRRLVLAQAGLGDVQNETSDLAELIGEAFQAAGVGSGGWDIDLILLDIDPEVVRRAREKFGPFAGPVRMHYHTADIVDSDAMEALSERLRIVVERGVDYFLTRNVFYENATADAMRDFALPTAGKFEERLKGWAAPASDQEQYGFTQLISLTLALKNIMRHFGREGSARTPGTRYLIDPVPAYPRRARAVFAPAGMTPVGDPLLGVLELADGSKVEALGLYSAQSGLRVIDTTRLDPGSAGARMAAEQGPGHESFFGADAARELIDHFGESTDKVLEFMFGDGVRHEEIRELTVASHGRQSNVRGIRHVLSFSVRRVGDPAPKTFFIKFYTSIRNEDEAKREMFDEAEYHRRITRQFGPDSPVIRTMIVREPNGIWASRNGVRHIEVQELAPGEELRHDTVITRALWRQTAVMLGRLHQHVFHRDLFVRSGGRRGGPNMTLKRAHVFIDATPGRERVTFIDLGMAGPADGSNRDRADAEREIFLENFEHMFGAGMVERGEYPDLMSARADFEAEYQRGLKDRAPSGSGPLAPIDQKNKNDRTLGRLFVSRKVPTGLELGRVVGSLVAESRQSILQTRRPEDVERLGLPEGTLAPYDCAGKCDLAVGSVARGLSHLRGVDHEARDTDGLAGTDPMLRHAYLVTGVKGSSSSLWVDPTLNQFFTERLPHLWSVGRRFMEKEKELGTHFADTIIRDGFVPFDPRLHEIYAYAFADLDGPSAATGPGGARLAGWAARPVQVDWSEGLRRAIRENSAAVHAAAPELVRELGPLVIERNIMDMDVDAYVKALERGFVPALRVPIADAADLERRVIGFYRYMASSDSTGYLNGYEWREADDFRRILGEALRHEWASSPGDESFETDVVGYAADVFARIVSLQAFENGNHRIGDFVMNLILAKNGLPTFVLTTSNMIEYYRLFNTDALRRKGMGGAAERAAFIQREIRKDLSARISGSVGARMAVRIVELNGEVWERLPEGVRRGILRAIDRNSIIKSPLKRRTFGKPSGHPKRSPKETRSLVLLDEKSQWLGHAVFDEGLEGSAYLADLVVKKGQRGRDMGTRLMNELFDRLRSEGRVDRVTWLAAGDSARFYQRYLTDRVPYWQGGDKFMALISKSSRTPEDFRRLHPSIHARQRRTFEMLDERSVRVREIIRGLKASDWVAGIDEAGKIRYPIKAGNRAVRESRAGRSLLAAKVSRIPSWSLVRLTGPFDEAEEDGTGRIAETLLGPAEDGLNLSGENTGWSRIKDPLSLERHVPEMWRRSFGRSGSAARMAVAWSPAQGTDREDHRSGSVRIGRFRYVAADASETEPAQDVIRLERPLGGRKDLFDYDRYTELALQMIDEALEGAARPVTAFDFGAGPGTLTLRLAKDPAVHRVVAVERSEDEIAKLERALKANGVLYERVADPDAAAAAARDPLDRAARVVIVGSKFEDFLGSLGRSDLSIGPGPSALAGGTDLFVGNLPDVPGRSMARKLGEYFSLFRSASDRDARIVIGGGWDVSSSFGRKRYSLTLPDGDPDPDQPDRAAYTRSVSGLEAEGFRFEGRVLTESGREFFGLIGRRDPGARMAVSAVASRGKYSDERNQDSFLQMDLGGGWQVLAVFDGVGGAENGALASRAARDGVAEYFDRPEVLKQAQETLPPTRGGSLAGRSDKGAAPREILAPLLEDALNNAQERVRGVKFDEGHSGTTALIALARSDWDADGRTAVWTINYGDSQAALWDPSKPDRLRLIGVTNMTLGLSRSEKRRLKWNQAYLADLDDARVIEAIKSFEEDALKGLDHAHADQDDRARLIERYRELRRSGRDLPFGWRQAEAWIYRRVTTAIENGYGSVAWPSGVNETRIPTGGALLLYTDGIGDVLTRREIARIVGREFGNDPSPPFRGDQRSPEMRVADDLIWAVHDPNYRIHPKPGTDGSRPEHYSTGPEPAVNPRHKRDDATVAVMRNQRPAGAAVPAPAEGSGARMAERRGFIAGLGALAGSLLGPRRTSAQEAAEFLPLSDRKYDLDFGEVVPVGWSSRLKEGQVQALNEPGRQIVIEPIWDGECVILLAVSRQNPRLIAAAHLTNGSDVNDRIQKKVTRLAGADLEAQFEDLMEYLGTVGLKPEDTVFSLLRYGPSHEENRVDGRPFADAWRDLIARRTGTAPETREVRPVPSEMNGRAASRYNVMRRTWSYLRMRADGVFEIRQYADATVVEAGDEVWVLDSEPVFRAEVSAAGFKDLPLIRFKDQAAAWLLTAAKWSVPAAAYGAGLVARLVRSERPFTRRELLGLMREDWSWLRGKPSGPRPGGPSAARMADAKTGIADEPLPPAERFILNAAGETMKEVVERVGGEADRLGAESVFGRLYRPHADPLAWKLRPEWGGLEFREKLSRMTLDELGDAVREAVKRGDITGRAGEDEPKGRAYLKRFLEELSDLNGISHHFGNARRYDRFEEMGEPLVAEVPDGERRSAERYKALLQEIARRWSVPTDEERKALGDYLSPGDGFDADFWLRLTEIKAFERSRQKKGPDVTASKAQVDKSSLSVLTQRLSFASFFLQNSIGTVRVRTHAKGRSEGPMTQNISSGEWIASHGQLGELENISNFIHMYGAGDPSSSATALEYLIRLIQLENAQLTSGTSHRTVGEYLRRLIRDMDGSADLIAQIPDIHPDPRVVERFEPDGAQGVPQVPYGSLGAYFISKSFAGREDRLTPFRDAADRYVRTWVELKPRLSELAQAAFADTLIPPFVPDPEADLHKLLTHEDAGTAEFERWVDLGRGPLGDEERDFLVRFAARVHRETSLKSRLASGDGALRLPVGVTSQYGFAVIGVRERKGEVELFVGRNVIYRGMSAELDAVADREVRNAAEALADVAARAAGEFEREMIEGVARLEGSSDFNRFIQVEVSQLISKDPRTRAVELRLLVSALKWVHEQKAHTFTKFYLNPAGLDEREAKLIRSLAETYRMRVGAPTPDEIRHHNAVPVVWRSGKNGGDGEAGPNAFDGWVNVLFPEPGEGLQPYGRAAYLSKAAVLGAVPDAGSSKDLWGDFKRARPEAFDPKIFDQARGLYPENTFESPADFLPAIREPGPTRRPALLSHLIRVGARLAELQRAIQQTEIMA